MKKLLTILLISFLGGSFLPAQECGDCDGKVTLLALVYHGSETMTAFIVQRDGDVVYDDTIETGDTIVIQGSDNKGTLGTNIDFYLNNDYEMSIHTSCSDEIGVGSMFGYFRVIYGESRNGGPLCPIKALPVVLSDFNVCGNEGIHYLSWEIQDAINLSHFEIEYSRDLQRFESVHYQPFTGQLRYIHEFLAIKGDNYYRLKMVDHDDSWSYSNIISKRSYVDLFTNLLIAKDIKVYDLSGQRVTIGKGLPTNIYLIEYKGVIYKLFKL
jgi:hypothetical protein